MYMCIYIYIYIYIHMIGAQSKHPIPVSVNKNTPSMRALAMESCGTDCSPAPDLVCFNIMFPRVFLCGGISFSQTPVS